MLARAEGCPELLKWIAPALALLLGACVGGQPAAPALAGTIVIGGSGGAYPVLQIVAAEFRARHPGVSTEFQPSSTTAAGIQQVDDGRIDVASIGREPTASEARPGTEIHWAALDAIAITVHSNVTLGAITTVQLRGIYSGTILDWSELGAAGGPIVVIDRPEDETAKVALRAVLGRDVRIAPTAISMPREADAVKAVEKTPGAIGFYSASYALTKPAGSHVVALDGMLPDLAHLRDGTYPMTRPIGIVVSGAAVDRSPLRELVAFIDAAAAAPVLEASGFVAQRRP